MDGADISPRAKARLAGALYLVNAVGGLYAEVFVRGRVSVAGNPAATAANILAHQTLYRSGMGADLVSMLCEIGIAFLFFELFKPVNRGLAMLMVLFRLIWVAIFATITLFHIAPLLLLTGNGLGAFHPDQLQALALLSLRLHTQGYLVALLFFGVECLLVGILILQSKFLPHALGILMALAGALYLTNSFGSFLAPELAGRLSVFVLLPCAVAEWALTLWLLIVGLNEPRWREQAEDH